MSGPAVLSPPPSTSPPSPRSEVRSGEPGGAPRPPRPDRHFGRALRWAIVVSAAAHVLFLLLSPLFFRFGEPPGEEGTAVAAVEREWLRAIIPSPSDAAPAPEEAVEPVEDPAAPTAETPPADPPGDAAPTPGAAPPAAGEAESPRDENRLRPGLRDRRLWVAPREPEPEAEPTQHERYMEHLQARIDRLNDSIAGDAERARRATDWTVRDGEGRRWGVSSEGIHLGDVTLPPVPIRGSDSHEAEARERRRQREEIDRQAEDVERRREWDRQIRDTRERRDGERRGGGG